MSSRAARSVGRISAACATHWCVVIACALVVLVASIVLLARMRIDSSLEAMLGRDAEAAGAMHRVTTRYRAGDSLMVLISADNSQTDPKPALRRYAQVLVARLELLDRDAQLIEWLRLGPDPAVPRFAAEHMLPAGAFFLDDAGLDEFAARLARKSMAEQFARNESLIATPGPAGSVLADRVLADPLRLFEIVPESMRAKPDAEYSIDEQAVLLRIGARAPPGDLVAAGRLEDLVRVAVAETAADARDAGLRVELGGAAAIATTATRTIRHDSIVSTVASVALLYILFVVFYRRWSAALLIGAVAGVGMLAGFAVYASFSSTVSPLAAAVAALLAGLGVDYSIHFLAHYDVCRAAGDSPREAVGRTAERMLLPITTNCMTSIFGFASLWASDIKMLRDFAMMGSAGLIGALIAAFLLLPALLAGVDRAARSPGARPARFGVVADVVAARPRRWMISTLVILGVLVVCAGVRGIVPSLEADLTKLHPQPNPALRVTNEIISRFTSQGEIIPVEIRAESSDSLVVAAHVAAESLSTPACRAAGVEAVLGLHQLVPDPRRYEATRGVLSRLDAARFVTDFNGAVDESAFRIEAYEGYRDAVARMISTREPPTLRNVLAVPSIAERLFPHEQLADGSDVRETVLLVRLSKPLHERAVRDATVSTLREALRNSPGATVAGLPAVSVELEAATRTGLPISIAVSLGLVLVWLIIVFRSPIEVLLALVPLACAAVFVLCFMSLTGTALNPINCVAIPLLDGIAVDAGVFLVAAARTGRRSGEPLAAEFRPTLHAVLLAVATTATGFASMCFASTPAIQSLGLVAAVGIIGSLVGAVAILVPLLLMRGTSSRRVSIGQP